MLCDILATNVSHDPSLPQPFFKSILGPRPGPHLEGKEQAANRIGITVRTSILTAAAPEPKVRAGTVCSPGHTLLLAGEELYTSHPLRRAERQPPGESYP